MKPIKIAYKGKMICITKDTMSYILSATLILFALFLSGAFNFAKFDFDFARVGTVDFWLMYLLKVGISICLFFAIYLIRRTSNLKKAPFVTARQDLKDEFELLCKTKRINHMDFWLKYVYNYEKKLEIYKGLIQNLYRQSKEKDVKKSKFNFINEHREKLEAKKKETREYCEKELEYIEKHEKLISAYRSGNEGKIEECRSEIKRADDFSSANIKWRNVYTSNLFNDSKDKENAETIFVNEKKEVAIQLLSSILIMLITYFAVTIAVLEFADSQAIFPVILSIITTLSIALSSCMLALKVADAVYEQYLSAWKNKLKICYMFHEDLSKLSNDAMWAKGEVENKDVEREKNTEERKKTEEKEIIYYD